MLSPNMHSKRIFRWMGAETEMTLIFDVLEMMYNNKGTLPYLTFKVG